MWSCLLACTTSRSGSSIATRRRSPRSISSWANALRLARRAAGRAPWSTRCFSPMASSPPPGLHPALINLLIDAAREIHGNQGYFEAAGEFPGTAPVDLPVSPYADQHKRFGPSFLYNYLPFWVATVVERLIIVLLPLAVILVPLFNYLPQFLQWRWRSR